MSQGCIIQNLTPRRQGVKTTGHAPFASFAPLRQVFQPPETGTTSSRLRMHDSSADRFCILLRAVSLKRQRPSSRTLPKLSHQVTAASYPLGYFAKQLAGDSIEVQMLTPPAESTKPWRPSRGRNPLDAEIGHYLRQRLGRSFRALAPACDAARI